MQAQVKQSYKRISVGVSVFWTGAVLSPGIFFVVSLLKNAAFCASGIPKHTTQNCYMNANISKLECELACAICHELFVDPVTTECAHSFCKQCLNAWLRTTNLSCPVCRLPVRKPPVSCLCLEHAVDFVVSMSADGSALHASFLLRRNAALLEKERATRCKQRFERDFQNAVGKGAVMLQISRLWSTTEQLRFCRGIQRHKISTFREAYCAGVGLTTGWVGRASAEELRIAAINVMLRDVTNLKETTTAQTQVCTFQLRSRLEMFILYG